MTNVTSVDKEYNKQKVSKDYGETAIQLMLRLGWEIITPQEYESESNSANRVNFNLYNEESKKGFYQLYFSRDKKMPHYAEFANYQRELFDLANIEEPQKPKGYGAGLIILGILFPVLGIVLIIGAIVSSSEYSKKKEKYDRDCARANEAIAKTTKLFEKYVAERGDTMDEYLEKQGQKLQQALS